MTDWLLPEWIAAITSSTGLAVMGFVVGTYYKAKVEKSIQDKLDGRLETLKSTLRKDEALVQADLREKGEQIAALRNGALSGLASRNAAIDRRRLEAIDRVWAYAVKMARFKIAAAMTAPLKMDKILDAAADSGVEGEKLRQLANIIWNTCGLDNLKQEQSPDAERPFLPPLAWALFSVYRQVLGHPAAQLAAMRAGAGSELLSDPKPLLDLVKTALPHQANYIDKWGTNALHYLIDELEEALLAELRRSLISQETDQASVEQAAVILKAAAKAAQSSPLSVELPRVAPS